MQAAQTLDETRYLLDLASRHEFIAGVVGWVDLRSASVEAQLQELTAHPKLKGVRHVAQDEPDDRFLVRDDVLNGISALESFGLAYDILIYPRQLPAAAELVRRFPRQRFVLDHLAKPDDPDGRALALARAHPRPRGVAERARARSRAWSPRLRGPTGSRTTSGPTSTWCSSASGPSAS